MEPSYKEIAEDLRYQFNKFIELWKKAEEQGLIASLEDTKSYHYYSSKANTLTFNIYRTERF